LAGIQYWDPDGDPSNNNTNGTGTGALGSLSLPISVPSSPTAWEAALWTDDTNLPDSITSPLVNFKEGDDAIFWGVQVGTGTTPDVSIGLNAPHTVNSLSFYSPLSTATTYNYWLGGGNPNYLTNITGVINADGGSASYAAASVSLVTTIQVPLVTTNGLQTRGSGTVAFATNMMISGGPIVISGFTRPGTAGGIKLPTAAQWNTTANGPYVPFPTDAQIIITNGGNLTLNGTKIVSSKPIVIWDGTIGGAGGVQAPQYVVRTCRFGYNAMAEALNDDGTGNTTLLKTGNTFFGFSTTANTYKGGTIISQGAIQWLQCTATSSCLGSGPITLGDTNTGNIDVALCRGGTAPSATNTNLVNDIVVTTNGTGRVFIGNEACAGIIRLSGNVSLGRSAYFGGSGSAVNGPNYAIAQRGTIFDGLISGAGGVIVAGASGLFYSPTDPYVSSQAWWSGGTVELTNPNNTYSGGSTVSWGTLEAAADGSLGTGNVTVNSPGILQLDTPQGIATTANLTLGGAAPMANLNYSGTCTINALSTNGGVTYATSGTFGSPTSGAANTSSVFTGNGVLQVVTAQTGSTTTLASSLNPANLNTNYGMSVTFTATVASVGTGTPTGTVAFNNGTKLLGTSLLSGSVATFTTSNLPVGTNAITAWYSGDASFVPSGTLPLSQVIITSLSTNNVAVGITSAEPGTFSLVFQGTPGAYYSVVTSTNMATPMANWTVVPGSTTLVTDLVAGSWGITVTNTGSAQFYRAKVAGIAP
jgi:autotransporter-associated beta strand protein